MSASGRLTPIGGELAARHDLLTVTRPTPPPDHRQSRAFGRRTRHAALVGAGRVENDCIESGGGMRRSNSPDSGSSIDLAPRPRHSCRSRSEPGSGIWGQVCCAARTAWITPAAVPVAGPARPRSRRAARDAAAGRRDRGWRSRCRSRRRRPASRTSQAAAAGPRDIVEPAVPRANTDLV